MTTGIYQQNVFLDNNYVSECQNRVASIFGRYFVGNGSTAIFVVSQLWICCLRIVHNGSKGHATCKYFTGVPKWNKLPEYQTDEISLPEQQFTKRTSTIVRKSKPNCDAPRDDESLLTPTCGPFQTCYNKQEASLRIELCS
jgi:hypothetical protein